MYNAERKEQFLREKERESVIANNIRDMFQMSEKFEERYSRDLCEFGTHEISDLYKYYSTPNVQTLVQLNNSLEIYTNWCINNGLVPDNQNHFSEMKSEMLCECIDFTTFRSRLFSRNELMEWLNKLPNYVDRFILLGIFEGIPVIDGSLTNVKLSDLNGNVLTLSNGTTRTLSGELVNIMHEAAAEDVRLSMGNNQRKRDVKYVSSPEIARPAVNSVYTDNNKTLLVGGRTRACFKYLGINNIPIKTIAECGRMWYISRLAKENGCSVLDTISICRRQHEEVYGKVQNLLTYGLTYGKLISEIYT